MNLTEDDASKKHGDGTGIHGEFANSQVGKHNQGQYAQERDGDSKLPSPSLLSPEPNRRRPRLNFRPGLRGSKTLLPDSKQLRSLRFTCRLHYPTNSLPACPAQINLYHAFPSCSSPIVSQIRGNDDARRTLPALGVSTPVFVAGNQWPSAYLDELLPFRDTPEVRAEQGPSTASAQF